MQPGIFGGPRGTCCTQFLPWASWDGIRFLRKIGVDSWIWVDWIWATPNCLFGESIRGWSMHLHIYCEVRGVSPTPIPTVLHNWIRVAPCLSTPKNEAPLVAFFHNQKRCQLKNLSLFLQKKTNKSYCWKHRLEWTCWLPTKPCHPPVKTRERDCRPSECCHQAQGKILSFFCLPKSQEKKNGGEKSSSSKNTTECFFFFQKGGRKPNQFSTNSLYWTNSQPILYA